MNEAVPSKDLVRVDYCDFGRCSVNCPRRCESTMDRSDGAPTLAWREGWRVMQARAIDRKASRAKPKQHDLFGEAA